MTLRTTWADKTTRQVVVRNVWTPIEFTDLERGIHGETLFPTVDGHMDVELAQYHKMPVEPVTNPEAAAQYRLVAPLYRPEGIETRFVRVGPHANDPIDGRNEFSYDGPILVSQYVWDSVFSRVVRTMLETWADTPIAMEIRYRRGPSEFAFGNFIGKVWER